MRPTRTGVFGGTFDPPHNGHLVVAANALAALELDVVLLVVAGEPWQKTDRQISPPHERLGMVQALVADSEGLVASSLEVDRPGPSYTADTLAELSAGGAGELFLILGSDAAAGLPTWERVEEVRTLATPVLVDRPGVAAPPLPGGWEWVKVDIPRLDISSSDLRRRFEQRRPLDGLVPQAVMACAARAGLYRGRRDD